MSDELTSTPSDSSGVATPAPITPVASTPESAPAGPASSGPDKLGKLRFQAKVAGVIMMVLGAFFTSGIVMGIYQGPHVRETFATYPGGNVVVEAPGHGGAAVVLQSIYGPSKTLANGTLDDAGRLRLQPTNATFLLQVRENGTLLWSRQAFVPQGTNLTLKFEASAPVSDTAWLGVPTELPSWYPIVILLPLLVMAGGYAAFRLRGPRLALGGALALLTTTAFAMASYGLGYQTILFVGTAGLCFYFIYRARPLFGPFWVRKSSS